MIYPSLNDLMKKTDSRYSLVIATAKRARVLSAEDKGGCEKPVSTAIREIYHGEVIITEARKQAEQIADKGEAAEVVDELLASDDAPAEDLFAEEGADIDL